MGRREQTIRELIAAYHSEELDDVDELAERVWDAARREALRDATEEPRLDADKAEHLRQIADDYDGAFRELAATEEPREHIFYGDLIRSGMRRDGSGGWTVERVERGLDGLPCLADPMRIWEKDA